MVSGSLAATLLLFAPPVLLLGTVSPILVTLVATASGRVGPAVGADSAVVAVSWIDGSRPGSTR